MIEVIFLLGSGWLPVWASLQHHCQAPRLEHGLLGSGDYLHHHHSQFLCTAQHPHQDGPHPQEGRLGSCSQRIVGRLTLGDQSQCTPLPTVLYVLHTSGKEFMDLHFHFTFMQIFVDVT